jgi:hypothetical protein
MYTFKGFNVFSYRYYTHACMRVHVHAHTHTHTHMPAMCLPFNGLSWHSCATPASSTGHFFILTANLVLKFTHGSADIGLCYAELHACLLNFKLSPWFIMLHLSSLWVITRRLVNILKPTFWD